LEKNTMKKAFYLIFCLLLIITMGAGQPAADDTKSTKETKTWSAKNSRDDYLIGSGDILEIATWKEEDFSREEVLVRLDGKLTFPLLNDVQAAGLTTLDLKRVIEKGLKTYVSNPVVTVNIKRPLSKQFYVLGEVLRTGEYPLVKHLTVLQAFALAGGFTEWASKKEIILLRHEDGQDKIYRINYKNIVKGKNLSQNIKLKADDTIIVP
jgi:polysaccharide export outer membrane protein